MIGFVQNTKTGNWQCARAKQVKRSKKLKSYMISKRAVYMKKSNAANSKGTKLI